jgi:hypothetical protein
VSVGGGDGSVGVGVPESPGAGVVGVGWSVDGGGWSLGGLEGTVGVTDEPSP